MKQVTSPRMRYALEDHSHGGGGWTPIGYDPNDLPPGGDTPPQDFVGMGRPDVDQFEYPELFDAPVGSWYHCINTDFFNGVADYTGDGREFFNNGAKLWRKTNHVPANESIPTKAGTKSVTPSYWWNPDFEHPEQGIWEVVLGDTGTWQIDPGGNTRPDRFPIRELSPWADNFNNGVVTWTGGLVDGHCWFRANGALMGDARNVRMIDFVDDLNQFCPYFFQDYNTAFYTKN